MGRSRNSNRAERCGAFNQVRPEADCRAENPVTGPRFQIWSFAREPFSGHSISFARLPVLLFSGHLPVFPQENAFSNNFQKNAAFWKNPENIWLKFGQNSTKFWEILQNICKNQRNFQRFLTKNLRLENGAKECIV